MKLRPCIDIHGGKVKQIVGGTLQDEAQSADENFVSEEDAAYYAGLYRSDGLKGGHIILLDPSGTEAYEADREQAMDALRAFPGGMQIGGGMNPENSAQYIEAGASHVIVTSYVFREGRLDEKRLDEMVRSVGAQHLTLDLSCRRRGTEYYIVTDRWQKFTELRVSPELMDQLSPFCSEFLIHAVDAEGKKAGIDEDLAAILGQYHGHPVTYAGGIRNREDLFLLNQAGSGRLDATIGSALDLFGGTFAYKDAVKICNELNP